MFLKMRMKAANSKRKIGRTTPLPEEYRAAILNAMKLARKKTSKKRKMLRWRRKKDGSRVKRTRLVFEWKMSWERICWKQKRRKREKEMERTFSARDGPTGPPAFSFAKYARRYVAVIPIIKKRKRAVRKISAGDLVRPPNDMKLAEAGEKMGKDCIRSS